MKFCQIALDTSKESTQKYQKHGAVLIKGNTIIAAASNTHDSHAEVNTVTKALYRVLQDRPKGQG